MKKVTKSFSKKALSLVLALCLILTAMATTFSVFANTEPTPYLVEFESPAIPMYEMTKVNLNNIQVEFERDGTPVNGADIDWLVADGENISYNSATNYLSAYGTGIAKLSATNKATGVSKNVYVVVAETGATEFNLLDYDFSTDAYVPEEWNYVFYNANGTGTYYSSDPTQSPAHIVNTGGYVKIGPNNNANNGGWINHGILMSANPMFKDFADYTVTTTAKAAKDNEWSGLGIVGRTNIDENGVLVTNKNMILSYVMGYGKTVRIKSNNAGWWAAAAETYGDEITPDDAFKGGDTAKHTITTKFDGENIVITRDTYEIFDLSKATDAIKTAWGNNKAVDAGAPGMMTWDLSSSFYTFKVSLNVTPAEITYLEDIVLYTVTDESPAIPMNALTVINTNDFMVEFNGSYVMGDKLDYTLATATDGVIINNDDNTISAYTPGVYTVTATDGYKSTTLYITVKNPSDTEWVLYETDFTADDAKDIEGWSVYTQVSATSNWIKSSSIVNDFDVIKDTDSRTKYKGNNLGISLSINSGTGLKWGSNGAFILDNDVVNAFADYKITATVHGKNGWSGGYGFGIFGRGSVSGEDTAASINLDTVLLSVKSSDSSEATAFKTVVNGTSTTGSELSKYKYLNNPISFTYEFSGDKLSFTASDGVTVEDANNASKKGVVGVYAALYENGYFAVTEKFKVALNNAADDMPNAKALDLYHVTDAAPAIPMNVMSQIDVVDLLVNVDGADYLGNKLTYKTENGTTGITIENGIIKAFEKGLYPVTVSADNKTDTVYVVVKNRADSQWVIYDADFTTDKVHSDWTSVFESNGSWGTFPIGENFRKEVLAGYTVSGESTIKGFVPYKANYTDQQTGAVSASAWGGRMIFYHTNDLLKQFANYTVELNFDGNPGYHGGWGIVGRIQDSDGEMVKDTTVATGFNVNASMQNAKRGLYLQTAVGTIASTMYADWDYPDTIYNANGKLLYNNEYKLVFENENVSISSPNDDETFTATTDVLGKGSFGIHMNPIFGSGDCSEGAISINRITFNLNDTEATAPKSSDLLYDASDIKVLKNNVLDLSNVSVTFDTAGKIAGRNIHFVPVQTSVGEVANGKFVAFSEGSIEVVANYAGETKVITINVVTDGANTYANAFADATITVVPNAVTTVATDYSVQVAPQTGKALAPMGLKVLENGTDLKVYNNVDITANKFAFETLSIDMIKIEAEYIDATEIAVAPLGATIRLPDEGIKTGIKFGNRINVINGLGNRIADATLNGVDVEVYGAGTLLIPSALLNGELNINTQYATDAPVESLSQITDEFADMVAVLIDIPETMYNTEITARAYIAYTIDGGEVQYLYGDAIARSYNQVYNIVEPARHYYNAETGTYGELIVDDGSIQDNTSKVIKVEQLLEGGTNHYLDDSALTDDLSYGIGETITYSYRIKGNYKLKYKIYKDKPEENLYGDEEAVLDTDYPGNTVVKSGVFEGDVFKYSTAMNTAGAVRLDLTVLDANDKVVATFIHSVIVDFDNVTASVAAPADLSEKYNTWKTDWSTVINAIEAETQSTDFTNFWSTAQVGDIYDGTYIYVEREADQNTDYAVYDIQLSTESDIGSVLSGATKVKDLTANTTDKKFAYNDYTKRPASFNLVMKKDAADDSLSVMGAFMGYGDASSAGRGYGANSIYVNMNSHGIQNNESADYYTAINKVSSQLGGIKNFCFEYNPNSNNNSNNVGDNTAEPEDLYFYGILKRDYIAMQFAKMLPQYKENSANATNGGSMGGWQSVIVTALDDSVKTINASVTWMGSVGNAENGYVFGGFTPRNTDAIQYFSTVHAAGVLGSDVNLQLKGNGLGDYTSPPSGIVAAYNAATCKKSIDFTQYKEHGTSKTNTHYVMSRSAAAQ